MDAKSHGPEAGMRTAIAVLVPSFIGLYAKNYMPFLAELEPDRKKPLVIALVCVILTFVPVIWGIRKYCRW